MKLFDADIFQRLGKYHRTLAPGELTSKQRTMTQHLCSTHRIYSHIGALSFAGLHVLIPFFDRIAHVFSLKEMTIPVSAAWVEFARSLLARATSHSTRLTHAPTGAAAVCHHKGQCVTPPGRSPVRKDC